MKQLTLLFTLLSLNCFAQNTKYKFDETLSIELPKEHSIVDTLGLRRISAPLNIGNIVITKTIEEQIETNVFDEAQLQEYYKGYQKGFMKGCKGKAISEEIIKINNVIVSKSVFAMPGNDESIVVENYVIYLKDHTYTVGFFLPNNIESNFNKEKQKILSSIKFVKGLTIEDQFNSHDENSPAGKAGQITGYILFIVVLIFIIWFIVKKSKAKWD
ncbi:MAG: hypothetical protein ABIQ27_02215 [Flavobacterium sp.]|uniref:hypothetical protein n=1 Tax=Flavobacterium sp. TaxID=239 RepID=UPI003267B0D7